MQLLFEIIAGIREQAELIFTSVRLSSASESVMNEIIEVYWFVDSGDVDFIDMSLWNRLKNRMKTSTKAAH